MTIDPQLVALLETLGPPLLAAVATLMTLLGSLAGLLARAAWRSHQRKMDSIVESVGALASDMKATKNEAHADHTRMRTEIGRLEVDLEKAAQSGKSIENKIFELSGTVKSQQGTIVDVISKLAVVTGKLDAVFSFAQGRRALEP